MRRFKPSLGLICPKCSIVNDVSRWQIQYVAPVLLNEAQQTYSEELIQVFCYMCHYKIEDFLPADTIKEIATVKLTAEEWLARAAAWIKDQQTGGTT